MSREYHRWYSQNLEREMECLVFGHYGTPFIVIPTSKGRFYQWEDFGMIAALQWALDAGKIKLFCIDSIDDLSWYAHTTHPVEQMNWQKRYETYILEECIPFIQQHCNIVDIPILITGTSFGAFHAMSIYLRYPKQFRHAVCMSGIYHISDILGQFAEAHKAYDPYHILTEQLTRARKADLCQRIGAIIYCGQGAFEDRMLASSKSFSELLTQLNIPHIFNLWGHDVEHHWYWWEKQFNDFLNHTMPSLVKS